MNHVNVITGAVVFVCLPLVAGCDAIRAKEYRANEPVTFAADGSGPADSLPRQDFGEASVDAGASEDAELIHDTGLSTDAIVSRDAETLPDQGFTDRGIWPDAQTPDLGFPDSGVNADAQIPDRGLADASFAPDAVVATDSGYRSDARPFDSGFADVGFPDQGFTDSGIWSDASSVDTGFADSGFADAGRMDAGFADAGPSDVGVLSGYVVIRPGTFMMGAPMGELGVEPFERPQHQVTITRPFWMKATEVTQGEWRVVMGSSPSRFQACGNNCPVERVSWNETVAYLNALSRREGLPECYAVMTRGTPPQQIYELTGLTCRGYRLPTEAEWEYAARAGSATAFSNGPITDRDCSDSTLSTVGWYCGNAMGRTWPIAQKPANAWGLSDMHGNVQEWTDTCYGGAYTSTSLRTDPVGPSGPCDKVNRGGAWSRQAIYARCASRNWSAVTTALDNIGFRPARTVP